MRNILRKVAVAGISTTLLTGVAFASMPSHDRDDHHDEDTSYKGSSSIMVKTDNDTDLFNLVMGEAETGDNHADRNHEDGRVTTGDASGTVSLSTTANSAKVEVAAPDSCNDCGTEADKVEIKNNVSVYTHNDVDLKNIVKVAAETGNNTAMCNGDDGSVTTGSASLNLMVTNMLNSSEVIVN